jgi:hypothetical protein
MVYIDSHPQQLNLTEALAAVSTERRKAKDRTSHSKQPVTIGMSIWYVGARSKSKGQGARAKIKY